MGQAMNTDQAESLSSSVSICLPSVANAIVPVPRVPVSVRPGTIEDLPFLDALQRQHYRELGYFPTKQFEGYIALGGVLVAESNGRRVGYVISRDRYLKRDELGVIFQLCVAPGEERKLIGAELVREVFARSAYGCKLYCCWCAQDLTANRFWESIGFVPIAFRAGSGKKGRVHIFWQKRIREGDTTTPWWFPAETTGGAIAEGRIVLPIPPDTHWSDAKPMVLPGQEDQVLGCGSRTSRCADTLPREKQKRLTGARRNPNHGNLTPAVVTRDIAMGGLRPIGAKPSEPAPTPAEKKQREPRKKQKNDPRYVAAARELRDRYLEHVNADPSMLLPVGKYDLSRALPTSPAALYQLPSAA
jgi:ribosomal protein S18 acetylase RimI-like enzyme